MRALLRFGASVLAVSGALLVADAVATVLWQEPLSALLAWREQTALAEDIDLGSPSPRPVGARRLAALARRAERAARPGRPVGQIELPTLGRRRTVVEGTSIEDLRRGPGHFPETRMPGAGSTAGIAGHRTTYGAPFRTVDRLEPGDPIVVRTPYARLTYRVERTRIVPPTALWVVRPVGYERLVLTACHPLYSAAQRIVVFARFRSATEVAPTREGSAAPSMREASRASSSRTRQAASASATANTAPQ